MLDFLKSSVGGRVARGATWTLIAAVLGRMVAFPVGVLLARVMGREGYGELAVVYGSVETFAVFGAFGLGLTATKHVAQFRERDAPRAGRMIALSMVVAAVTAGLAAIALFALAPSLASHMLAAPHLEGALRVS